MESRRRRGETLHHARGYARGFRRLNAVKGARYLLAATFGNVHGVYKPGQVKLKPSILKEGQETVEKVFGKGARFALVFHGGSDLLWRRSGRP